MIHNQIDAYVPEKLLLEGKREMPSMIFEERFAILDAANEGKLLASRGFGERSRSEEALFKNDLPQLLSYLKDHRCVAFMTERGLAVAFGDFLPDLALIPIFLPFGEHAALAWGLRHLEREDLFLEDAVRKIAARPVEYEAVLTQLNREFFFFDRVMRPEREIDFRLHCAHIAQLAGCRADVTEMPIGHYPIGDAELSRWSAFLLCLMLSLRGDSATGPRLSLKAATRRAFCMQMDYFSEHKGARAIKEELYSFLSLPCFSDFSLTGTKQEIRLEAILRRRDSSEVCASPWIELITIGILIEEGIQSFDCRNT